MDAKKSKSGENRTNVEAMAALETEDREIDLKELFFELLEHAKWIVAAAVLGLVTAFVYTQFFVTPLYESTAKLYVLNSGDSIVNLSDLQLGNYLAADYTEVFKTWEVNEMVRSNLSLNYTYTQLGKMLTVSNPSDTRILHITVSSPDPKEAAAMANEYAKVVSEYVSQIMSTEKPNVFSEALVPTVPSSPNKVRNVLLGFLLGALAAIGVIALRFVLDDKIKSSDDITKYIGIPVLAAVPVLGAKVKGKYGYGYGYGYGRVKDDAGDVSHTRTRANRNGTDVD